MSPPSSSLFEYCATCGYLVQIQLHGKFAERIRMLRTFQEGRGQRAHCSNEPPLAEPCLPYAWRLAVGWVDYDDGRGYQVTLPGVGVLTGPPRDTRV